MFAMNLQQRMSRLQRPPQGHHTEASPFIFWVASCPATKLAFAIALPPVPMAKSTNSTMKMVKAMKPMKAQPAMKAMKTSKAMKAKSKDYDAKRPKTKQVAKKPATNGGSKPPKVVKHGPPLANMAIKCQSCKASWVWLWKLGQMAKCAKCGTGWYQSIPAGIHWRQ